jgi:hypothetical protein
MTLEVASINLEDALAHPEFKFIVHTPFCPYFYVGHLHGQFIFGQTNLSR